MDSELDQNIFVRGARAIGEPLRVLEGLLTMFFGSLLLMAGGAGVIVAAVNWEQYRSLNPLISAGVFIGSVGWLLLDLPYMFTLIMGVVRGSHPVALKVALRQRVAPKLVRPIVFLWWIAHCFIYGFAGAMAHASSYHVHDGQGNSNPVAQLFMRIWFVVVSLALGFSCNGFLMMGVCTLTESTRIRQRFWRCRGLVDLLIICVGVVASLFIPAH